MTVVDVGAQHDRCGARRLKHADSCSLPAGWGTDHVGVGRCKLHGGATQSHTQKAQVVIAQRQAAEWGARLDVTPAAALFELVQAKAGEVAYWDGRVRALTATDLASQSLVTKSEVGEGPMGMVDMTTRTPSAHAFVTMLHKAQDQLAAYSAAAIKAGLDAELVKAATLQGQATIRAIAVAIDIARAQPDLSAEEITLHMLTEGGA